MDATEIEIVRREARGFLGRVQQLPGFAQRLETVGATPEFASALPFWSIRRLSRGDESTGKIVWRYLEDAELTDEQRRELKDLEDEGYPVRTEGASGEKLLRVPVHVPAPDDETRDALEAYREAVETFADDVLLRAQWAPGAVHDALRLRRSIALPPPPSMDRVAPPVEGFIRLDPDLLLPRGKLRELGEALVAASELKPELGSSRTATWEGALEAVRAKLDGKTLTATQRSHRFRGRRLLDGAANGVLGVDPVDWAHDRRLADPDFEFLHFGEDGEVDDANS